MRIIVLTQYFPPEIGAPQNRLSDLARRFVRNGHSVTVLTAMPNYPTGKVHAGYGGLLQRENWEGMKVIRTFIYPTQKAGLLKRLANYFSFMISSLVFGIFTLDQADYLFVESPPLFLGVSAILLSRLKRAKLIFNVSDLWPESAVCLGVIRSGSAAHRASSWLEARCYRNAFLVSGQSKTILDNISRRFSGCPTFLLSNGVDTTRYGSEQRSEVLREELCPTKDCLVLYAGLHGLAQGLDQVIEAAKILGPEIGLRFVFIGDGPEKEAILGKARALALKNVAFLESRPADQVPALLATADILLVPLKKLIPGAVPSKLYEAMASGKPVVLVAADEAAEIVRMHNVGIVVQPGDIPGLAAGLRRLQNDRDLRETLGRNGREAAVNFFDRSIIGGQFIDHLSAMI